MRTLAVLLFFAHYFIDNGTAEHEKYRRNIYGFEDSPSGIRKPLIIERDDEIFLSEVHTVEKRSTATSTNDSTINPKINYLNDTHKQLWVHWAGKGSNVITCLARDTTSTTGRPSAVYISYDYGDSYENKTDLFKMADGSYATLEKFYGHPINNTHIVFVDIEHKLMFVTTNHCRDVKRIELNFTPSVVSFYENQPSVFVVLDENDPFHRLWVTEDFGNTFRQIQNFVKNFNWIENSDFRQTLVLQRMEPSRHNSILYSNDLFSNRSVMIQDTDIKDFFVKENYIFTTKLNKGVLELYVSFKLGKQVKCVFDTQLEHKSYFVVDVSSNRAFVIISHSNTTSHLYVSEKLDTNDGTVKFTVSLEDVFCYFPNNTWHDTWIHNVSKEAFAHVYKVEGLSGIYIASRVLIKPQDNKLGPQHLGSVITFDHGLSWHLIKAPTRDYNGQPNNCEVQNNCSLHLSSKFSQLYPYSQSLSIVSSKSAPGIIIATGVVGKSLKGVYGLYISDDAGLTWKQTLEDPHFFKMGDHGGILVATKHFRSENGTRYLLYSTDVGENWQQVAFHDLDIRLNGLITEPGGNTTVFTMFGYLLHQEPRWVAVKLDLIKAFEYNCSKDDYKTWSPNQSNGTRSYIPCALGQQLTYQRRISNSNCYNGKDFNAPLSLMPCSCDIYDYECDFGFIRTKNPGNCIRNATNMEDPYKVPLSCKPGEFYKRTKGYRKIPGDVCIDGFENHYMPEEIPCPLDEVLDFLLFVQRKKISRFNLVTRTLEDLPVKKLENVIAIDYDMRNNCLYWADIALHTIARQCSNGSKSEILVSNDLGDIEGMALDWISNNLYFVDGIRAKIELIRTDINHSGRMRRTILGPNVLKKPRGIALHPKAGYMFWTDWSIQNPSVNRADLDGENIKKLFGKPKVEWPNGITIDYIAERIYWVDARKDYIGSSDLHGDYFKLIISHDETVSHPFAVAVFKNNIYWDDWKQSAIFGADKDGFRGIEVLRKNLTGLMDLKIYAHGIRVNTNGCTNSNCSFVCVGKPKKNQSSCLCPDGMEYNNSTCLYPSGVHPLHTNIQNTCKLDYFTCSNGPCIPRTWKCDGEDDCGDSSDETDCGIQTCPPNYFVCGDGKCLPLYWRCDYENDCSDGSDEKGCPWKNCTENQFTCNNGRCIAIKWRCDGENDCRDGSDEQNCDRVEPTTCSSNEFLCTGEDFTCIPLAWHCDGEKDCRDGADENNCNNRTCLADTQFSCGPPQNRCIYSTWVCDGDKDCPDGRDEVNCTTSVTKHSNVADQFVPKNKTCQSWMFRCQNQRCIPYWWKCDDADDCGDGSDEIGCSYNETTTSKGIITTPLPSSTCGSNQYQCATGICIFSSWVCDGKEDCLGGDDERKCFNIVNCTQEQFPCDDSNHSNHSVVLRSLAHSDRPDGSECSNIPATGICTDGYFLCDGTLCISLENVCDGWRDCADGCDEENCPQVLQMRVDERGINESSLLLYWSIDTLLEDRLEFMPTISEVGSKEWKNQTWINSTEYQFNDLKPATEYNMTIYIRVQNTTSEFPALAYVAVYTEEGGVNVGNGGPLSHFANIIFIINTGLVIIR